MFCTTCGRAFGEHEERCRACGAPPPAAWVPTPPTGAAPPPPSPPPPGPPSASPPPPPGPPSAGPGPWQPVGPPPPGQPLGVWGPPPGSAPLPSQGAWGPPAAPRRGRATLPLVLLVVGALALAAVGFAVVRAVSGGGGGASSPEDAVADLAEAVGKEDPAAALAVMNPEEVLALGDLYTDVEDRARALGYAPKGKALAGVDLRLSGLRYKAVELGGDVAKVNVTGGTLRYDVTRSRLGRQVNRVIERNAANDGSDDPDAPAPEPDERSGGSVPLADLAPPSEGGPTGSPFLMAVKHGDGWYVSPMYTAAEYLVQAQDLPAGTFDDVDPGEATADSPEAAARALATALSEVDTDAAVAQLSGTELLALRSYRKALDEAVQQAFDDSEVERPRADIDTVDFTTQELDDGSVEVSIAKAKGTARWTDPDGDQQADFEWDGRCLRTSREDADDSKNCITVDTRRFGITKAFVVATEEDGGWRISPVSTLLRYARMVLPRLDANLVSRLLGIQDSVDPTGKATVGRAFDARLNDAGFAVYDLAVSADERFTVTTPGRAGGSTYAYLVDDRDRVRSTFGIIEPGRDATWKLVVTGEHYRPATVRVAVTPVSTTSITVGSPVTGDVDEGGVSEFTFDGDSGDAITIDIDDESLDVVLVGPDGDELIADDSGTYTLDSSGEHRVQVSGGTDDSRFRLSVEPAADFVLGNGTTDNALGALTTPTSSLEIELTVRGGATVVVTAQPVNAYMDITVTVIDPDGTSTPYNGRRPGESEDVRFFPDETTTYTLRITSGNRVVGNVALDVATA